MKRKPIQLFFGVLCFLAFLSINTSICHTRGDIKTKLFFLNQKALADSESGGDHNFCKNDPGDDCETYGVVIHDCDETWMFWKGCDNS